MSDRNIIKLEAELKQIAEGFRGIPVATIPLPRRATPSEPARAYAPVSNNPARLASATVQSVGRIGETSAEEVDKVRVELRCGYEEIDAKLGELADAFRGHARIAEQHIQSFCLQATEFFDTINAANRKLQGRPEREAAEPIEDHPHGQDDGREAPEFLTRPA